MDEYTNLENFNDTQLISWLEKQQLHGLNLTLARRFAKLHAHYWRQQLELNKLHVSLRKVLSDFED